MALKVTLVKASNNVALSRNNHTFDQCGGTFGRADSNTWVLPDPEKFLSSCHCAIVFIDSQYYLEDKSTNGTFVNGSFEPLGRGIRHPLRNDDFFEIGDFRFSIQLEQQAQDFFASPFDATPFQANTSAFDPLPKDDFFGDAPVDSSPLFSQQQDPLALWDQRPQPPQHSPFNAAPEYAGNKESGSLLDDFVGLGKPTNEVAFSAVDMTAGMDQSVSWPSARSENVIPENWDDDLVSKPAEPVTPITSKPINSNKALIEDDWLSPFATTPEPASAPREMPFDIPRPNVRIPLAERVAAMELQQSKVEPLPVVASPEVFAPVVEEAPKPQPVPHVSTQARTVSHTLVESLGLDLSRLSEADIEEINRVSGLLIREIVDGMLGVLRSRASIKNEFRMNVTTIQPIENNPLKFSVCVDDALENLFIKKSNAYKKPVEAFREGFQEIAEHQLAMIAGIRQGFEAMMERFNPEQLEKSFNKHVKGSVIPGMQKAKYWNSYTDYYQGFTDNMESSFQHLFGSDFVSAYEDQLRRLTAARKRGEPNEKL